MHALLEPMPPVETFTTAICARCAGEASCRSICDGRLLCAACVLSVCWNCGTETPDVLRRTVTPELPALCTACCASYAGRERMRR
jgi:hypothetical protein